MSKATKRRPCPATQRQISAAECGANRISRYNCPATCPFNPFSPAQYDTFLQVEAAVMRKSLDWFLDSSPDRAQRVRELAQIADKSDIELEAYELAEIYYKRDASGRTCAERWAAAGFPTLNNDERVVQRATMQLRLRLIEVHRVLDDLLIEAVDLLEADPKPFLICDRALAARACRFTTVVGWFFPLPYYWRLFGFALPVSEYGPCAPQEAVEEIVRHLGGPAERDAWAEWFALNLARFAAALEAVARARQEQMFAGMDAEFGKAVYELRAPFATCRDALDAIPAVALDDLTDVEGNEGFAEARVWFDESAEFAPATQTTRPVLGRVLLGQTHWRLEAMGAERFVQLRTQFERELGDRVRFSGEAVENLTAHLKSKEPTYDRALVPPRLLEQPMKIVLFSSRVASTAPADSPAQLESNYAAELDRAWLDQSVPALNGQTPRQAAHDPALRPKLIRLLKDRVRRVDKRNLETGSSVDINWLLKELGAHEIIFDPPPPRAAPQPADDEVEDDNQYAIADELDHWPPLPPRPFTKEEALERLLASLTAFETLEEAIDAMAAAGGVFVDDVQTVIGNLLTDDEHMVLESYLVRVWFAFVPPGRYGPNIEPEDLQSALGQQLEALASAAKGGEETINRFLLEQGLQPAMVRVLAAELIQDWDSILPRHKNSEENGVLAVVILKAVIELLDARCRGK